ncbi:hypothetical protein FQ087_18335 [Sporosarcina sp. ANT_H38]|uniref:hypothetical protein n=1 Tax=Sporosarcina sp. ANT_H38 TaxID=2597358 RepID=UPI0011F3083C|nr:hypothetical protein [Sporosarcina sp. ANT_H38]KAA0944085.1 hypothetical protein FQ087_18335 [Sporosarcina sp. ANT_H38]
MRYKILMNTGDDRVIDHFTDDVDTVEKIDEVYEIRDSKGTVLFTAPVSSVIFISLEVKS